MPPVPPLPPAAAWVLPDVPPDAVLEPPAIEFDAPLAESPDPGPDPGPVPASAPAEEPNVAVPVS
ncbi:MAG: hypothetical protein ACKO35_09870, partial [Planctomycetaceae bacterium]